MTARSNVYKPYSELGRQLRKLRLMAGISTQKALLDRLSEKGIVYTESFWSKVENGHRRPAREHLFHVLRLFREQGAPLDIITAQEIFRLADYASMNAQELTQLFQIYEIKRWHDQQQEHHHKLHQNTTLRHRFNVFTQKNWPIFSLILWFLYQEVLEFWRNLGWKLYRVPDLNWWGILFPLISVLVLYWQRRILTNRVIQFISTVGLALLTGIAMILTIHRVGIIIPVLSTLGGITIASLDALRDTTFLADTDNEIDLKVIVELSLGAIGLLILVSIAMNLILFMAPPGAFAHMPYELRVFRGIEILLATVMILGIWIFFWFTPLFDITDSPSSIEDAKSSRNRLDSHFLRKLRDVFSSIKKAGNPRPGH